MTFRYICCLTETCLESEIPDDIIDIEDFVCHDEAEQMDTEPAVLHVTLPMDGRPCDCSLLNQPLESPNLESMWLLMR
jgi:hypothetical protein